jgi:hypothetical protein
MVFTGDERVYETVTTEGLGKYIHNVKKLELKPYHMAF